MHDLVILRQQRRESITYQMLLRKGINKNVVLIPDVAFQLSSVKVELPEMLIKGKTIGINISPMIQKYGENGQRVLENYEKLIEFILSETDCTIALIPHVVWNDTDDRIPLTELYKKYKETNRIVLIQDRSAEELKSIIAQCCFFVGARTHATIAAYSSCVPTLVVSSVFIPRVNAIVAKDENNNKDLTELFTRVGRIQFIILALIFGGFCVVGRYFIEIWAGKNYRTAYIVALILIAPVTVPLIQNLGIEIQRAKNMHKFRSIVYFLIAIFNVIISIPLAKSYGEVGAALGTMITMTIGNIILMNWYYQAKIKLNIIYFWKNIFELIPAVGISIVIAYICKKYIIVNNIGSFLIVGIIYVTVYAVCMFSFGMNKYEKELVKKPIKRLLRKR